jgi:hypothetical protein
LIIGKNIQIPILTYTTLDARKSRVKSYHQRKGERNDMDISRMKINMCADISLIIDNLREINNRIDCLDVTPRTLTSNRDECVQIRQSLSLNAKAVKAVYKTMAVMRDTIETTEAEPEIDPAEEARLARIAELKMELADLEE